MPPVRKLWVMGPIIVQWKRKIYHRSACQPPLFSEHHPPSQGEFHEAKEFKSGAWKPSRARQGRNPTITRNMTYTVLKKIWHGHHYGLCGFAFQSPTWIHCVLLLWQPSFNRARAQFLSAELSEADVLVVYVSGPCFHLPFLQASVKAHVKSCAIDNVHGEPPKFITGFKSKTAEGSRRRTFGTAGRAAVPLHWS